MGNIYSDQGNHPKALDYYQKSLKIREQIGDQQGIAVCLMNMGNSYYDQGNYPKALDYYQKSLKIQEQIGNQQGIAYSLNNMGSIYSGQGNYPKALEYFQKSLKINEQIGDQGGIANCLNNIGAAYNELHQPQTAKEFARKGLKLAQEIKHMEWMKRGAEVSYRADSALGDWKSAFEYHKLYKQYSDSLHNEEKAKEFGRIESRHQFEKEAEEAKRKEQEAKRLAEIETERRNNLQYLSIFGGIIALFGVIAFLGRFRIPVRVLNIALFAALLILFEFLLILFDPILDQYTGGIPVQKLVFNSVIALVFAPLHGFLERKLKRRYSNS
jgi:tetratricopeptide (TPR) repeat protein